MIFPITCRDNQTQNINILICWPADDSFETWNVITCMSQTFEDQAGKYIQSNASDTNGRQHRDFRLETIQHQVGEIGFRCTGTLSMTCVFHRFSVTCAIVLKNRRTRMSIAISTERSTMSLSLYRKNSHLTNMMTVSVNLCWQSWLEYCSIE